MAYFAELDAQNKVVRVVSIPDQVLLSETGKESERLGIEYCKQLFGGTWLQTSYNTINGKHVLGKQPFRKNYAGIGFTYDAECDAFEPPKHLKW